MSSCGKVPASEMTDWESRRCMSYWKTKKTIEIPKDFETMEELAGWMLVQCARAKWIHRKFWVEKFN